MTNILNRIASSLHSRFHPTSPDEYFALRLATRLGEPAAARHYSLLVSEYTPERLLCTYRHARFAGERNGEPARRFHKYLSAHPAHGGNGRLPPSKLLAVRVER